MTQEQDTKVSLLNFDFKGHDIRIYGTTDKPWFVAKDIAQMLGIVNYHNIVASLKPYQKALHTVETLGGAQKTTIINEGAVYKMITNSRKPEAEAFTDWVFNDVLPSIRRKGKYELEIKINELENKVSELEHKRFLVNENDHIRPIERLLEQGLIPSAKYYELIQCPRIIVDNKT